MMIASTSLPCWITPLVLSYLLYTPFNAHAVYKCTRHGEIIYTDRSCDGEHLTLSQSPSTESHRSGQNDSLTKDRAEVLRLQKIREQRERQDQQIRDLSARGAAAREHLSRFNYVGAKKI